MKNFKNKIGAKVLSLVLAALTLACFGASCAKNEEKPVENPVLVYGDEALPLYFYEFMLSRMKGTLARNKYEVSSSDFWDTVIEESGETYEEYYNRSILENCKNYLAAAVFFDQQGLKLSERELSEIDEEIKFYLDYDFGGDVSKFDLALSKFGLDMEKLRDCYIIESKYDAIVDTLYAGGGLIDAGLKEEYYKENYVRFKQILFPKFYYEYERDEKGDLMYFDPETGKTLYDKEKGEYHYDENDNYVKDRFGVAIRFDENGNILYNKEKGQPSVKLDENGEGIKVNLSANEIAARGIEAAELKSSLSNGKFTAFEAEMKKHVNIEGYGESYPDGFYLSATELSGYEDYMSGIYQCLLEMEIGEIRLYESDYGFHIIMKYELDDGKYDDGEYAEWFTKFESSLINTLFLNKVQSILPSITVNEEIIDKARSIRRVGTNYDY